MNTKQCSINMEKKTISVSPETRDRLKKMKVIDRETMESVIKRLLDEHENKEKKT